MLDDSKNCWFFASDFPPIYTQCGLLPIVGYCVPDLGVLVYIKLMTTTCYRLLNKDQSVLN
jgi:hypothetical protein